MTTNLLNKDKDNLDGLIFPEALKVAEFYNHLDGSGNYIKLPIPKELKEVLRTAAEAIEILQKARQSWVDSSHEKTTELGSMIERLEEWKTMAETLRTKCEEMGQALQTRTEDCREAVTKLGYAMQEIATLQNSYNAVLKERDVSRRLYWETVGLIGKLAKQVRRALKDG